MSNVLKLTKDIRDMSQLPAVLAADPWAAATDPQRRTAELREVVVRPLAELVKNGASINNVAKLFLSRVDADRLDNNTKHVLALLARDGGSPSLPTMRRFLAAYVKDGKAGLLPAHTGRVRQDRGWEKRAIELYNIPGKPGYADVADRLRFEGFKDATESRVQRFLKALPSTLGENSPARLGKHLHKLKRQMFQRRHLDDIKAGEMYAGDGHTIDCYLAHPNTGKLYRPELTVFIDVKSKYITGVWLDEAESGLTTLYSLSGAMKRFDHVPTWVYIDQGAGYRNKMLSDEVTGFYARYDIEAIAALPGNPHGKGWIERFFRTVRDKHDKFFAGGMVYCGDDMAPETNRRLPDQLEQGKRQVPTVREYFGSLLSFLDYYHHQPMDALGGRTPAQVWAEMTPNPLGVDANCLVRPHELRTVTREQIRLHNRHYYHEALALYEGKEVDVEYDLHDDSFVTAFDKKGRLICTAKLVNVIGVLPMSRIEEGRDRREKGQLKRLERHADEVRARRQDSINTGDVVAALENLSSETFELPQAKPTADVIDIDLLNWRQDK